MSEPSAAPEVDPEDVRMERLAPNPGAKRPRKRVGRGQGSGHGKTAGRGTKGLGARSGGGVRPGYQGGQIPFYMQQGKQRGPNKKMSMPMGPFRTSTVPVNVGRLDVFEAGSVVDLDALVAAGLVKNNANRAWPVKILGEGEIDRALTVRADAFSASARAKIEAAGGTVELVSGEAAPEAEAPQEPADAADDAGEAPGDDADS
jgi:large subunit ribosomal protein L15